MSKVPERFQKSIGNRAVKVQPEPHTLPPEQPLSIKHTGLQDRFLLVSRSINSLNALGARISNRGPKVRES